MLSLEQGKKLIKLARDSISSAFSNKKIHIEKYENEFPEKQGVFVTLHKDKELRGCIGFPEPMFPLYKAIFKAARAAAFEDPRFPAVESEELKNIEIEISVLTVPKLIKVKTPEEYLQNISIGDDGLIIRETYFSGLLLPQVFTEWNCDAKKALEMTCEKAGLDRNAWQDLSNKIYKFQAQIFAETKPNGEVIERFI